MHFDESDDRLIIETIYDPEAVIEENAEIRASGPVKIGSKNNEMVLAMRIPLEHVEALRNLGYNLLSPDPAEVKRTLLYVQANQPKFLTTDKKMIAERKQVWV